MEKPFHPAAITESGPGSPRLKRAASPGNAAPTVVRFAAPHGAAPRSGGTRKRQAANSAASSRTTADCVGCSSPNRQTEGLRAATPTMPTIKIPAPIRTQAGFHCINAPASVLDSGERPTTATKDAHHPAQHLGLGAELQPGDELDDDVALAHPHQRRDHGGVGEGGDIPSSARPAPIEPVSPSMIMGNLRAAGRLRAPATTTPTNEPPPKADRMIP